MKFIKVTELGTKAVIFLNVDHIISFQSAGEGAFFTTTNSVENDSENLAVSGVIHVRESADQIYNQIFND